MPLVRYPFVRLALAIMAGRLLYDACPPAGHRYIFWLFPSGLLLLPLLRLCLRRRAWLWCRYAQTLLLVMAALMYVSVLAWPEAGLASRPPAVDFHGPADGPYALLVVRQPVEKPKSYQVQTEFLLTESLDKPRLGQADKMQLYLPKDSLSSALKTGDVLLLRCRPDSLQADLPYHRYLQRQGFVATAYVRAGQWSKAAVQARLGLRRAMDAARSFLIQRYRNAGLQGEPLALISALCLGDKTYLDKDQKNMYAAAGVSHILAVSGMHVGMLCQFLGLLLFWMRGSRSLCRLRQLLLIVLLWGFACLTGLSASVLRAVIMFSVSAFALCIGRKSYTWNALAFAACLMLLVCPSYWQDVSFQLSFLAVASILACQPYFQRHAGLGADSGLQAMMVGNVNAAGVGQKSPWWRQLWQYPKELLCLSLSAQIGTAPLSVYYFHQFSNCFWLSNLLLVPLATVLTYLGVSLLLLADVPLLSQVLASVLDFCLQCFIDISAWLTRLPLALSENLYPSAIEVALVYLLLLVLLQASQWGRLHYWIDYRLKRRESKK